MTVINDAIAPGVADLHALAQRHDFVATGDARAANGLLDFGGVRHERLDSRLPSTTGHRCHPGGDRNDHQRCNESTGNAHNRNRELIIDKA